MTGDVSEFGLILIVGAWFLGLIVGVFLRLIGGNNS